jgi:hypothetical protein
MPNITVQDAIKEAQRLHRECQCDLPRWVSRQRLSPAIAQYRLECQAAMLEWLEWCGTVEELGQKMGLTPPMFTTGEEMS